MSLRGDGENLTEEQSKLNQQDEKEEEEDEYSPKNLTMESKFLKSQMKAPPNLNISEIKSPTFTNLKHSFLQSNNFSNIHPKLKQNFVSNENIILHDTSVQGEENIDSPNTNNLQSYLFPNKLGSYDIPEKNKKKSYSIANNAGEVNNLSSNLYFVTSNEQRAIKIKQRKPITTLRYQDVVFLKFKQEDKQSILRTGERAGFKSYLMTTDNRNQLECRGEDMESMENPFANFRRCLFRILNPRQFLTIGQSTTEQLRKTENLILNKKKIIMNEANKYEEGEDFLVYGMHVMLYHEYSQMFVTFNPLKPAQQNGCVQCSLEKRPNQFSVFRILPNDYSRKMGDKIYDSDVINIQEVKKRQFFLNVQYISQSEKPRQAQNYPSIALTSISAQNKFGLNCFHINASEDQTKFKVKFYMSSRNVQEKREKEGNEDSFQNGDIVKIQHLDSGSFLSLRDKKLSRFVEIKNCRMQQIDEGNQAHSEITFSWKYLDQNKVCSPDNYEPFYDADNLNSSYSFWEIQRKEHFIGGNLFSDECFRLKNLSTGLFLSQDKNSGIKLMMTWDGREEECLFFIKKDKTFSSRQMIFQSDTFKIYNSARRYFYATPSSDKSKQLGVTLQKKVSGVSLPYLHTFNGCNKQVVDFLEQSLQIYNSLLQFHYFLQSFSIEKQKGLEEVIYTYQEALQQQKKLESEHQHVQKALNDLESLLSRNDGDSQLSFSQKQQFLREQKILEQLVSLAKLIDIMSHLNKSSTVPKDKQKLVKISNRNSVYKISEKSPQFIINKHLQNLPIQIYRILYLGTKQNASWSTYIFDNDDLFSGQLRYYPKEVGTLLKEAVKNLYNLKSENGQGEEIIEWAKLIEPIDGTKQNIQDQTLYVEFLSLAIVDPFQNPLPMQYDLNILIPLELKITRYQNKCSSELFMKNKSSQSKAIIQFHQGLSVSFYHEIPVADFLANNKCLEAVAQDIHLRDRMQFSLEKMCKDAKEKDKSLRSYIQYISSFIGLLANLCNGRNKKSLIQVEGVLGMSENFIYNALRSDDIDICLKTSFLQLYEVAFLDDEPFLSFSKVECRTYVWNEINTIDFTSKTAEIFKQISNDSSIAKNTLNFDQRILPILLEFWEAGLYELDFPIITRINLFNFSNYFNRITSNIFFSSKGKEQRNEKEEDARWRLKFILSAVKVTRIAMDLGMFTAENLEFIVGQSIHMMTAFSKYGMTAANNEQWLRRLLIRIRVLGEFEDEIQAIVIEMSAMLRLFQKIKLSFQLNSFVHQFYKEFTSQQTKKKRGELVRNHKTLIQEFELFSQQDSVAVVAVKKKKAPAKQKEVVLPVFNIQKSDLNISSPPVPSSLNALDGNTLNNNSNIPQEEETPKKKKDFVCVYDSNQSSEIDRIVITYLLGKGSKEKKEYFSHIYFFKEKLLQEIGTEHIIQTMKQQMKQATLFCEELHKIEFINGNEELELVKKLEDSSIMINPIELEYLIKNFTQEELSKAKTPKNERFSQEDGVIQIIDIIQKITSEIKVAKAKKLRLKIQNVLRNLRIHISISKILELNPEEKIFKTLLERVVRFLISFSCRNEINQKEIIVLFSSLLNLLNQDCGAQKLLGIILKPLYQDEQEFKPYLQAIFSLLVSPKANKMEHTHIYQMLYSFLKVYNDHTGSYFIIKDNQQTISNMILQQQSVQQFLSSHKKLSDFQQYYKEPEQKIKQEIYLYKSLMHLISALAENNQLGIVQCQRIMIYEDMKSLLLNPQTPFIIKRELLKAVMAMYVKQTDEETNSSFTIQEMNELLSNLILRDLTSFSKHLEGLVDPDKKDFTQDDKMKTISMQGKIKELMAREFYDEKPSLQNEIKQSSIPIRSSQIKEEQSSEIIASPKEYWDYLYSGSKWNCSKDGLLQIIPECLKEIRQRNWLEFENGIKHTTYEEEMLSDLLFIIKHQCINMRGILGRIEDVLGINNKDLMQMLAKCIIENKVRKEKGQLKNVKLLSIHNIDSIERKLKEGRAQAVDAYLKKVDDAYLQEAKEQVNRSPETTPSKRKSLLVFYVFMEKMRKLIVSKSTTIENIHKAFGCKYISSFIIQEEIQTKDQYQTKDHYFTNPSTTKERDIGSIILHELNGDTSISRDDFINILQGFLKSFDCLKTDEIGFDDILFFFSAFTTLYCSNSKKLGDTNLRLDKQMFMKKLTSYIELNKLEFKKEQISIYPDALEDEYKKSIIDSFSQSSKLFIQMNEELKKEYPYKMQADQIMSEFLGCNDSDQRKKIKIYFDSLLTMLKRREDISFFAIFHFLLEELSLLSTNTQKHFRSSLALDSQGLKKTKEKKPGKFSVKYLRIQQSLIWNQKLYLLIISTLSEIFVELYGQQASESQDLPTQTEQEIGQNFPQFPQEISSLNSRKKENRKIALYCLKILNGLFLLSIKNSHAQLLAILKKPQNIKITRNFLSFLKHSFSSYLKTIDEFSNLQESFKSQDAFFNNKQASYLKKKKEEVVLKEETVIEILKFIETSCELCNEEFQNFFRMQKVLSSKSQVPLDILSEILYFVSSFVQLKSPLFKQFEDQSQFNLRYYSVINQCIATLKNLCNGTMPDNKDLLLNNTQFLNQLSQIITEPNVNLQSENLQDMRTLQIISNCIDLLLTVVVRSNNQDSLMRLISILKTDQLVQYLNYIYHLKIKNRLKIIQQERICSHVGQFTCSTSNCINHYITFHDQLLFKLGFNAIMVIELILDSINEDDLSNNMKLQEENSLLFGVLREMKKREEINNISVENIQQKKHVPPPKSFGQVAVELKAQQESQSKMKFQRAIHQARRSGLFKSPQHRPKSHSANKLAPLSTVYNEINDDNSSRGEDNNQPLLRQFQLKRGEKKMTIELTQEQIQPSSDYSKQQKIILKESLGFFLQYVGSVEIVKEGQISKVFFRIPLLSSFLQDSIRQNLVHKSLTFSIKNRLKLLIRYSEYFENEMRFYQQLSAHTFIMAAVKQRNIISFIMLALILLVNLLFLFDMMFESNGETSLSPVINAVFQVARFLHIIVAFSLICIITIERYPLITNQKYKELIKSPTRISKFIFKLFKNDPLSCYILDSQFLYFLIYFILTVAAIGDSILYSILLIDIIKVSEDLKYFGNVLKLNFSKLIKAALFCFDIVYIYSLIGAKIFTSFFNSTGTLQVTNTAEVNLSSFFSVSVLQGVMAPEGINSSLQPAIIDSKQFWGRFFYDLSFWILVNFLFLNLMLGLIIDAYGESSHLQRKYEKGIKRKCFVCGLTVENLESRGIDWEHHQNEEHNLNNYLNYIIHIKDKPIDECDGFEKYVKECITKEQPDFFPQRTTLYIQRQEAKQQENNSN